MTRNANIVQWHDTLAAEQTRSRLQRAMAFRLLGFRLGDNLEARDAV